MIFPVIAAVAAVTVLGVDAAPSNDGACWQIIGSALDRSAHSTHARFISYGEQSAYSADGHALNTFDSNITYRDDGLAYIDDERWTYPTVTSAVEPGPPVLGPYGQSRSQWLSLDDGAPNAKLPVIAHVYAHPNASCHDAGVQTLEGRSLRHLIVAENDPGRRGLHDMWLDPNTFDVARLVIRGPVHFLVQNTPVEALANYVIDVQTVTGHCVLKRVRWSYRDRANGQWVDMAGEYEFRNFRFSDQEPPGTFSAVMATAAKGSPKTSR